eukprot:jgi/Picsp_1/2010/NSC_05476-R1_probable atp-dependent rna helicase ddx20
MVQRTADVLSGAANFESLFLPVRLVRELNAAGYRRPSPVQEKAIPLARLGADIVIQAKAGTGKTLVFAVAAAEAIDPRASIPQVLVVAPTREIALQAADVALDVSGSSGFSVVTCIGGLPTADDERLLRRGCHLVVGTPGRLQSLIERKSLVTGSIKMLVLDEADRLMEQSFYPSIQSIVGALPRKKQILALSATFTEATLKRTKRMMRETMYEIFVSNRETSLLGVDHYCAQVGEMGNDEMALHPRQTYIGEDSYTKMNALLSIIGRVPFRQCIVFCGSKQECEEIVAVVGNEGYAAGALSSDMDQIRRIKVMNDLRSFRTRVLVCTDIASRGIDLDHVDLVVNMNVPDDPSTLAHRIGRAGRFGTKGKAVTITASGEEESNLRKGYMACKGSAVKPFRELFSCGQMGTGDGDSTDPYLTSDEHVLVKVLGHAAASTQCDVQLHGVAKNNTSTLGETSRNFEKKMDAIMNASVWDLEDSTTTKNKQVKSLGRMTGNHFSLLLDSILYDVVAKDCDASTAALFSAFDHVLTQVDTTTTRHRRELGSVQAHAFAETRHVGGNETLAQEADLLESLWDASMAQEEDTSEARKEHDSVVWNQFWQRYGDETIIITQEDD